MRPDREQRILELLASLSYRTGELADYLQSLAEGVSQLIGVDWSAVTLCQNGMETVLASSIAIAEVGGEPFSCHGSVTHTVVETGHSLVVEDADAHPEQGTLPDGYHAYLGVPLRTAYREVIGTICSFHKHQRHFTAEEVRVAEIFAERAATAIDNYQLYQLQQQFNQTLEAEVIKRTQELRATQSKLIEKERLAAIGEFAAMIIHEVRNPLSTIRMSLNSFQRYAQEPAAQERLALGLEEADRLDHLLNEILAFAKPQLPHLEVWEVNTLLTEMLPGLQAMPQAQDRRIEFLPGTNGVRMLTDRDKLKQVLVNLIRNACEAIAPGERVQCQVKPLVNGAERVMITIHNGGTPIPAATLAKLGQPFYSTKLEGTGLGLAIVKRIIDTHGGSFSLTSDSEQGTIACLEFPLAP